MRFFLSSYQIGNAPERLLSLLGNKKTAAVIMNAADNFGDSGRLTWVNRQLEALAKIGISGVDVDLRHYFGKPEALHEILSKVGLLWVTGGNTFTLRRAMRESGLDQMLPDLLRKNQIIYGGFSAGICVLSPSLRGIHLGDEPEKVPAGYPKEVIWDGLGLIDFYIVPHYRSAHPETEAMEMVASYYEELCLKHYKLRDGEALVHEDGLTELVGSPNE